MPAMGFRTFADEAGDEASRSRETSRAAAWQKVLTPSPGRLSMRSVLLILLFSGLMLLAGLGGDLRVLTQHEVFAAETAREMLASGDAVMPRFAGVPRLNKPPGMYWLIAGSMAVFQSRAEVVARLPAALAGMALALVVAHMTARWLGNLAGLVAGLMQASFAYVLMQARLAEADMPMALCVALAMSAFAAAEIDPASTSQKRRLLLAILFGIATGASVELKGVGVGFIYFGCTLWIFATRRWRSFRFLFHPAALISLVLVAGAWPLAIYLRDPAILKIWRRETFGRVSGEFGDAEPFYTYLINLPWLALPWWPFAMVAVAHWWHGFPTRARGVRTKEDSEAAADSARVGNPCYVHPRAVFLLCWFLGGIILLHLSSAKHKHYAIPMLPPITVVAAAGFCRWLAAARRGPGALLQKRIALAIVSIVGAAGISWIFWKMPPGWHGILYATIAITIGVSVTIAAYAAVARRAVIVSVFGTALAAALLFQFLVLPSFDDYKASAALARRANNHVPAGEPILLVKLGEAHAAYYLDHPIIRIDRVDRRTVNGAEETQSPWEKFLAESSAKELYILCPRTITPTLQKSGEVTEIDQVDHQRKVERDTTVLVRLKRSPN